MDDTPKIITMEKEEDLPYPWEQMVRTAREFLQMFIDRYGCQPETEGVQYVMALAFISGSLARGVALAAAHHEGTEAYEKCLALLDKLAKEQPQSVIVPLEVMITARQKIAESAMAKPKSAPRLVQAQPEKEM